MFVAEVGTLCAHAWMLHQNNKLRKAGILPLKDYVSKWEKVRRAWSLLCDRGYELDVYILLLASCLTPMAKAVGRPLLLIELYFAGYVWCIEFWFCGGGFSSLVYINVMCSSCCPRFWLAIFDAK